jgi:hypothetical protein
VSGWCDKEIAKERLSKEEKERVMQRITYHK